MTEGLSAICHLLGVEHVVVIDDTWRGIPPYQRRLIPATTWYERALLYGAALSAVIDTTVVCDGVPAPTERALARTLAEERESFRIISRCRDGWADITDWNADRLWRAFLRDTVARRLPHRSLDLPDDLFPSRTLCLPYQTLDVHHRRLGERFLLLDSAERFNNKRLVGEYLERVGLSAHLAGPIYVNPSPESVFCRDLIDAIDRYQAEGIAAYAKLTSAGVAGLANVVPELHPEIYDARYGLETRVASLRRLVAARGIPTQRYSGIVEQRLTKSRDVYGALEFTVGGFVVDGSFNLTYLGRNINSDADSTERMLHAVDAADVGVDPALKYTIATVSAQIFESLAEIGYSNGYAFCDLLLDESLRPVVTDFNLRRGLRSAGEALLAVVGGSYYDVTFPARLDGEGMGIREWAEKQQEAIWYGSSGMWRHANVHYLLEKHPADSLDDGRRQADRLGDEVRRLFWG